MPDAPRARRPRPVADAPVAALVDRAEALAKGWLLALVEQRPLARAAEVPAAELGREAPPLFAAVARALAADDALAELLEHEGPTVARLAGARDPAAVAEAVDALRAVVWAATLDALTDATPDQLADLSDRLAHISTRLIAGASTEGSAWSRGARPAEGTRVERRGAEAPADPLPVTGDQDRPDPFVRPSEQPPEEARSEPFGRPEEPAHEPEPETGPFSWPLHAVPAPAGGDAPLWLSALERRLGESARPGERTSLLLVELDGLERLRAATPDGGSDLWARASQEIRRAVRREDLVAYEEDGRTWVFASDTGRFAAEALARRIADGIGRAAAPHGIGLTASVGLAVHPDDGRDAGALAAYAEEEMLAARAAGVRVLGDSLV